MNDYAEVIAIVEGRTEQIFIEQILQPYLSQKKVYISATQISKSGEKGGDVKFIRAQRDIGNHLKQRSDNYVCTFFDYYGLKEWPGLDKIPRFATPEDIAQIINDATKQKIAKLFPEIETQKRFIPFLAIHEFETFLFSDSHILAKKLDIKVSEVEKVIEQYDKLEAINDGPDTSPSKRLEKWSHGTFKKTITGITIAKDIGVEVMRKKCPLFHAWLNKLENLVQV